MSVLWHHRKQNASLLLSLHLSIYLSIYLWIKREKESALFATPLLSPHPSLMLLSLTRLAHAYTARLTTCTYGESNTHTLTHTHTHTDTCAPKASPKIARAWETTSWHTHTQVHSVDSIYQHRGEPICWKQQRIERLEHTSPSSSLLFPPLSLSLSHSLTLSLWALQQGIAQDLTPLLHLPLLYFNRFFLPPIHLSFCGSRCSWQQKDIFISILERYESCYSLISPTTACVCERECVSLGGGGDAEKDSI